MSSSKILPSIISLFHTLLALGLVPTIYALPQYSGSVSAPGTTAAPQQYVPASITAPAANTGTIAIPAPSGVTTNNIGSWPETSTNFGPGVTSTQLAPPGPSIGTTTKFLETTMAFAQSPVSQITTSPQSAYNVPPGQDWNAQPEGGDLGKLVDNAAADTVAGTTALWTRDLSNKKRSGLAKQVSAEAASLSSLRYAQAASSILAVRDLYAQASNEAAGYVAANPTPVPAWDVSDEHKTPVHSDAQPTWDGPGGDAPGVGGSGEHKTPVRSNTQASFTAPPPAGGQATPTPPPPGVGVPGSSNPGVEGQNTPGNQDAPGGQSAPGNQNAPGVQGAPGNQNSPGEVPAQQGWDAQYSEVETMPTFSKRSVENDAYKSPYASQIPVAGSPSYASQIPVASATSYTSQMPSAAPTSYTSQMPSAAPTSYASQIPSVAPSSYLPQVSSAPPTYVSAQPVYSAVPPSSSKAPTELYARDNEWQPFNSTISPSNDTSPYEGPGLPQPSSSDTPSVDPSENTWSSPPEIAPATQPYSSEDPSVESGSYGGESIGSLAARDAQYSSENATAPIYSDTYGSSNGTDGGWNGGYNETDSGWNTGINDTLLARDVDISAAQEAQARIGEASS